MLKPRGESNFLLEAPDIDRSRHFRRQHLHDNRAAQDRVFGDEDPGHSSAAKLATYDKVGPEGGLKLVAKLNCHGRSPWP
jgi:hypothetical protein